MKAYSLDLRARVAAACAQPRRTVPAVAAQFSVSVSFVEKLLHRQRTMGSVAALPPPQRPRPRTWMPGPGRRCEPVCARNPTPRWRSCAPGWPPSAVRPSANRPCGGPCRRWGGGEKKERPRRRARHAAGEGLAPGLCRGTANRRFYLFQVCGRDEHQPDLLPPLRPGRRRGNAPTRPRPCTAGRT